MIINLNDQELHDAIYGSGAFSYGWWLATDTDDGLNATITMDDGNDGRITKTLTLADIRAAIPGAAAQCPIVAEVDWTDPECDSDVDANIADCILQFAMLGEVMFG